VKQKIIVVGGAGEGSTPLSAFDAALLNVGIGNLNLVMLSSIIPKDTEVLVRERYDLSHEVGQIQPVVLSHTESNETGQEISAGLGWALAKEGGVFIEISGCFKENHCRNKIQSSLQDMVQRRNWQWTEKNNHYTVKTIVKDSYSSVIVCALYPFFKI